MKTSTKHSFVGMVQSGMCLVGFSLGFAHSTLAQIMPPTPEPVQALITIVATLPDAAEPCGTNAAKPGLFTVSRDSGTNIALRVSYSIGGSARNGVDYAAISNAVTIPEGAWSADIPITPLGGAPTSATKTVMLQIVTPICPMIWPPPPSCYAVGRSAAAVVYIKDCPLPPTNLPPAVRITSPPNRTIFRGPVNVPIFVYARDPDGSVASVECFAGTNSLGFAARLAAFPTNPLGGSIVCSSATVLVVSNLFSLVWSNVPPASYTLTAKATDDKGASTISEPIGITVLPPLPPPPPPTNQPPVVTIVATDPVALEGTNCWVWPGATDPVPTWTNWPGAACRFFTNCGPKNATFALRRTGSTNQEVTVKYAVSGTATNGVDYLALPGIATIPAGLGQVMVSIVPIDDGRPDINKTVVLTLTPPTNQPPSYLVGSPRSAAATIIDSSWPRPVTGLLPDKTFQMASLGPDGAWYRIECSTNLLHWQGVCTNQVIQGSINFVDPDAAGLAGRFYRAMPEANPPQN